MHGRHPIQRGTSAGRLLSVQDENRDRPSLTRHSTEKGDTRGELSSEPWAPRQNLAGRPQKQPAISGTRSRDTTR